MIRGGGFGRRNHRATVISTIIRDAALISVPALSRGLVANGVVVVNIIVVVVVGHIRCQVVVIRKAVIAIRSNRGGC